MEPWNESLSEDWPSQPKSSPNPPTSEPASDPISDLTSAKDSVRAGSVKSRPPHPRFLHRRSTSTAKSNSPEFDGSVRARGADRNNALKERVSSGNKSASLSRVLSDIGSEGKEEYGSVLRGRDSRTISTSTAKTTMYPTVQQKSQSSSPPKDRNQHTPEWRRRLLGPQRGYADKLDLFGPSGLENMFCPPPKPSSESPKPARRHMIPPAQIMPSSPPIFVSEIRNAASPDFRAETESIPNQSLSFDQSKSAKSGTHPNEADPKFSDEIDFNQIATSTWRGVQPSRDNVYDLFDRTPNVSQNTSKLPGHESALNSSRFMESHLSGDLRPSDDSNASMSPIMVSKHNTVDGIGYAALDLAESEALRQATLRFSRSRQVSKSSKSQVSERDVSLGDFVATRRGSYSKDGSFRRRPLSPSSMQASRIGANGHAGVYTSSNLNPLRKVRRKSTTSISSEMSVLSPALPPTSRTPILQEAIRPKSSGSPMRLFDADYDTFTREKLYRRLSNIEDSMYPDGSPSTSDATNSVLHLSTQKNSFRDVQSVGITRKESLDRAEHSSRASSFGQGTFDEYQFQVDSSYASFMSEDDTQKRSRRVPLLTDDMRSVLRSFQPPDLAVLRKFSHGTLDSEKHEATQSVDSDHERVDESSASMEDSAIGRTATIGSKRPSGSPFKIPRSKRRRTIQGNEERPANLRSDSAQSIHERPPQAQSIIGKRKDASYEGSKKIAGPEVVALRQILKPRNRLSGQAGKYGNEEQYSRRQSDTHSKVDSQVRLANKRLASLGISKEMITESRKGSVTTQDYLDEATRVMELIRSRNRPRSGLNSGEESEVGGDSIDPSELKQFESIPEDNESTRDEFSRPPSREGSRSVPHKDQIQLDPRVISHLDKYKENGTVGLISSSMEFVAAGRNHTSTYADVESQPPNIRILPPNSNNGSKNNSTRGENSVKTVSSTTSSGPTTSKSMQTGSSDRSDTRRNIPPHTVSHLIPGQVAGMIYDGAKQTWVKAKNIIAGSDCEDDPFGGIPDLSVNEMQELERIKKASMDNGVQDQKAFPVATLGEVDVLHEDQPIETNHANTTDDVRPVTREGPAQSLVDSSSVPSKMSKFASSGPHPETRATSWGESLPRNAWKQGQFQSAVATLLPTDQTIQSEVAGDSSRPDFEIDMDSKDSIIRNTTHSPSDFSPLSSRSYHQDISHSSPAIIEKDGHSANIDSSFDHGAILDQSFMNEFAQSNRLSTIPTPNSKSRFSARRISFGGQSFIARPVSRIDEQPEGSSRKVAEEHRGAGSAGVQVTFSTPLRIRDVPGSLTVPVSTVARRSQLSLHLSPLADFTVNQIDESFNRDVQHVARRRGVLCLQDIDSTFGLATEQLIKNVTDVEPYEPYWDWIRHIELKGKGLVTLHDLDQFCSRIERMDVSNNELGQLNGAPLSLRDLKVSHNCLSNLTTWAHLKNLQFVDISGNQLECLDGFASLIHLRELRADDNKLRSLDGVFDMDGLVSLRARRNVLDSINFEGSSLNRLSDLDLRGNRLESVESLSALIALERLNLEDNKLVEFCPLAEPLPRLRSLKLSDNQLESLDVSHIPNLRVLYVDRNKLFNVDGLRSTTHLDSFSIREQKREGQLTADSDRFEDCFEIRKVYGSGNAIPQFLPQTAFLNLQYLELASCGIQQLPAEFGIMMPNVRVLNLNFNAITDIRPLGGIVRLKKLFLAGNRLGRLRKLMSTLIKFSDLSRLDMRNNPLTLGFYPPISETRMVLLDSQGAAEEPDQEPYTLPNVDSMRDAAYRSRLDLDTKLRIRVYEMLLASGCPSIRVLDGLTVKQDDVVVKDDVWEALLKLGIVKDIQATPEIVVCPEISAAEESKEKSTPLRQDPGEESVQKQSDKGDVNLEQT